VENASQFKKTQRGKDQIPGKNILVLYQSNQIFSEHFDLTREKKGGLFFAFFLASTHFICFIFAAFCIYPIMHPIEK